METIEGRASFISTRLSVVKSRTTFQWSHLNIPSSGDISFKSSTGSCDTQERHLQLIMLAALLRRISRLPSQSPIEAITFFFVLVTLVYFQLLQAVQDSEM